MGEKILLSVVVPVFNEETNITKFIESIMPVLNKVADSWELVFIADPCTDRTIEVIERHHQLDSRIKLVSLSRRFGQPKATLAGLHLCLGQAAVVMDL